MRDGHLFWPWWRREGERAREVGLPDPDTLHDQVMDVLKSIRTYHHSYRAALGFDKRSRLPLISVPTMVAAGDSDMLRQYSEEAAALIPGAVTAYTKDPKTPEGRRDAAALINTQGGEASLHASADFSKSFQIPSGDRESDRDSAENTPYGPHVETCGI